MTRVPLVEITHSAEETRAFGERLASTFKPGSVVFLTGSLGAGKTTLVQGICHGLGVTAWAHSPTFTLINEYVGARDGAPLHVYHCDFYRIGDPDELATLALDEVFYGDGVTLVEWPEIAEDWAPDDVVRITITRTNAETRRIDVAHPNFVCALEHEPEHNDCRSNNRRTHQ